MGQPEPISTIIARQLAGLGIGREIKRASVGNLWPELVGSDIATHTRVLKMDLGRLFVSVDSPTWRQELLYQKEAFIKKLNRELGEEIVADIIFTGP